MRQSVRFNPRGRAGGVCDKMISTTGLHLLFRSRTGGACSRRRPPASVGQPTCPPSGADGCSSSQAPKRPLSELQTHPPRATRLRSGSSGSSRTRGAEALQATGPPAPPQAKVRGGMGERRAESPTGVKLFLFLFLSLWPNTMSERRDAGMLYPLPSHLPSQDLCARQLRAPRRICLSPAPMSTRPGSRSSSKIHQWEGKQQQGPDRLRTRDRSSSQPSRRAWTTFPTISLAPTGSHGVLNLPEAERNGAARPRVLLSSQRWGQASRHRGRISARGGCKGRPRPRSPSPLPQSGRPGACTMEVTAPFCEWFTALASLQEHTSRHATPSPDTLFLAPWA